MILTDTFQLKQFCDFSGGLFECLLISSCRVGFHEKIMTKKRQMWPSVVLLVLCLKKHFTTFLPTVSLSVEGNCFIFLHRLVTVLERRWEQTVT